MPPPKTDEEIQASWGPKQWEFYTWYTCNEDKIMDTADFDAELDAFTKLIQAQWPDPEDQKSFDKWCNEWCGRLSKRMNYRMSSRELLYTVSQTNFLDAEKTGELLWAIDMYKMPWVPVGESNFGGVFTCYCFEPLTKYLEPNSENSETGAIENIILTMDLDPDVPIVPNRRSANSSEEDSSHSRPPSVFFNDGPYITSPASALSPTIPSDSQFPFRRTSIFSISSLGPRRASNLSSHAPPAGADTLRPMYKMREQPRVTIDTFQEPVASPCNHFVFVQLGALYVFGGDWEKARRRQRHAINEGPWLQNGYCVVVRINEKGEPGAVYAIYNHAEDKDPAQVSDDFHESELVYDHVPGFLHPECNKFALVLKIADSLDDLGSYDRRLDFTVISSDKHQVKAL